MNEFDNNPSIISGECYCLNPHWHIINNH